MQLKTFFSQLLLVPQTAILLDVSICRYHLNVFADIELHVFVKLRICYGSSLTKLSWLLFSYSLYKLKVFITAKFNFLLYQNKF